MITHRLSFHYDASAGPSAKNAQWTHRECICAGDKLASQQSLQLLLVEIPVFDDLLWHGMIQLTGDGNGEGLKVGWEMVSSQLRAWKSRLEDVK